MGGRKAGPIGRRDAALLLVVLATVATAAETAAAPWDPGAAAQALRVEFTGAERRSAEFEARRLDSGGDGLYLSSADIASLVRAGRFWREASMSLRLSVAGRDAVFTHGLVEVEVDGRSVRLPSPPYAQDGDLWLPVSVCADILAPLSGEAMTWDPEAGVLTVGGSRANVRRAGIRTHGRSTVMRLECSTPLVWRLERPGADLVRLVLERGVLARAALADVGGHGLIRRVTGRQEAYRAIVDVSVLSLASEASVETADEGRTLLLVLAESGAGLPGPNARGGRTMAQPEALSPARGPVRTVVIDPGHGGDDPGVDVGGGEPEKDLVLALARDLKDILEDDGFRVVLTRDGDRDMGPDRRAERANGVGGDLFLSLHAGGWFGSGRRGATAWTLPRGAASGTGDFVAWETVQQRHLSASRTLGEMVLARLAVDGGLQVHDLGELALPVLHGVDMPAVLVEVALLSRADDGERLRRGDSRRRIAASLANAVKAFRAARAGGG